MNKHQKRFIETTLPMVIGYGLVVISLTALFGFGWGILGIMVFTAIDVMMVRESDFIPRNIKYKDKHFPTLLQLIDYVKKEVNQK